MTDTIDPTTPWLRVDSLDLEAQGVARTPEGKVLFIEGALPGEEVQVCTLRSKNNWAQARITALRRPSPQRVRPRCPHESRCGGCKMQHLHPSAQVAVKQRALEDQLWHLGKVKPERVLRPIEGPAWGYRYRARLSVRYVAKRQAVLVGFHERRSTYVVDMNSCEVLPPAVSAWIQPLRDLFFTLDGRERMPQIELAVGAHVTALVLRHLEPLSAADRQRLADFGAEHGIQWWLQPKGPDSAHRLEHDTPDLTYELPEFGVVMPFKPTDFTQVNHAINRVLVDRALRLLDVQAHERVIDWFCGLGNFTLPLATRAREVLGIEGSPALVARSLDNAVFNGLADRTRFEARNLFELQAQDLLAYGPADRWLVDPPREGAFALVKAMADLAQSPDLATQAAWARVAPRRIVYVSCNPATLARDAGLLVHQAGYRCTAAGAINMFPHTAHVESMAVFERTASPAASSPPQA